MKLDDLPKKNNYQVPDRYFEELPGRVMSRVREKESENNLVAIFTFWRQPFLRGALAGVALLLLFIYIFTLKTNPSVPASNGEVLLSDITKKEAMEYLMASDQLEAQDLTGLPVLDQDLSHEFIQVSQEDILQAVENKELGDIYYY